ELPHRGKLTREFQRENPNLTRSDEVTGANRHFFVEDREHPFEQRKPFAWIRGYQVGGKSLTWGRWTQRWSDLDFEANAREGIAVDWPIRYADLAPWYSYVEKFVGISGNRDGLPQIPDGEFLPAMQFNALEKHMKRAIEVRFPGRNLVISRTANLSAPMEGRGVCMYRDRCSRGCPFGGYFSSNSATLPAAAATGNLTLHPDAVVHSIIFDEQTQRATGVRVIDAHTKEATEFFAKVIFVNAGTINTTLLLLNSVSNRFPNGLGNDSGQLGRNLMNHNYRVNLSAVHDAFRDMYYFGRRPTGTLIPRFRNLGKDRQADFLRGYSFAVFTSRDRGNLAAGDPSIGEVFKEKSAEVGPWRVSMGSMAEQLPYSDNRITLSRDRTDAWGLPLAVIDAEYKENEERMTRDMLATSAEMAEAAGFRDIRPRDNHETLGLSIHEMGTARMGRDPETSVLNAYNQVHAAKNVFVSDGACMTSSAWQNPSITYMALTARAAGHAVSEMRNLNL
ncbi:MAG TPA: GMC family oxidoreductase, partial [Opitutaceae bacterium]|nr:GMC family oxidoreductase [Opitutaceae bacterium]